MDFDQIAGFQGWDRDTQIFVMRGFIADKGLTDQLNEYAQGIADIENIASVNGDF